MHFKTVVLQKQPLQIKWRQQYSHRTGRGAEYTEKAQLNAGCFCFLIQIKPRQVWLCLLRQGHRLWWTAAVQGEVFPPAVCNFVLIQQQVDPETEADYTGVESLPQDSLSTPYNVCCR